MKLILSKSNKDNNYEDIIGRCDNKNIIIYFNKDSDTRAKEKAIKKRIKYIPEIKYTDYAILQNTSKLKGKIIYLSDYDKFTFDSLDDLDKFIDVLLRISKFNMIYGLSDINNYIKLYNKVKINTELWNELTRRLKYDASFMEFCKYLKELEDNTLYMNVYGFYTFILYELVYRARTKIIQFQ